MPRQFILKPLPPGSSPTSPELDEGYHPSADTSEWGARLRGFGSGALEGFRNIRNLLAGGTRVVSGVASVEGGLPGALISGGGETLAELIEGPRFNPVRIGLESGIGAVPLGKIFKVGKPVESAIRGGIASGVGTAGRELSEGEPVSPTGVAVSTGIGAATGGLLGALTYKRGGPPPAPAAKPYEVVPTSQTGRGTGALSGGKKPKYTQELKAPKIGPGAPGEYAPSGAATPAVESERGVPYAAPEPPSKGAVSEMRKLEVARDRKNLEDVKRWLTETRKAKAVAEKERLDQEARDEIDRRIAGGELKPGKPSVRTSVSAPSGQPNERISSTISYRAPKAEGGEEEDLEDLLTPTPRAPRAPRGSTLASRISSTPAKSTWDSGVPRSGKVPDTALPDYVAEELAAGGVDPSISQSMPVDEAYDTWQFIKSGGRIEDGLAVPPSVAPVTRTATPTSAPTPRTDVVGRPLAPEAGSTWPSGVPKVSAGFRFMGDKKRSELIAAGIPVKEVDRMLQDGLMHDSGEAMDTWLHLKNQGKIVEQAPPPVQPGAPQQGARTGAATAPPPPEILRLLTKNTPLTENEGVILDNWLKKQSKPIQMPEPEPTEPRVVAAKQKTNEALDKLANNLESADRPDLANVVRSKVQPTTPPVPEPPPVTKAEIEGKPASPLAKILTPPPGEKLGGNTGLAYRQAQQAFKRGEITQEQLTEARNAHLQALGKPIDTPMSARSQAAIERPAEAPAAPTTPAPNLAQAAEEAKKAEQSVLEEGGPAYVPEQERAGAEFAAGNPDLMDKLRKAGLLGDEKGASNVELQLATLLGLTGAATGAALNPLGNRWASALAGAGVGASLPFAATTLAKIGARPEEIENVNIDSIEGVKEAAQNIFRSLPQIQRFNYLMDLEGLPANAIVGPYGSAVMGALEHGLAGDERGWRALQELADLKKFSQRVWQARHEATEIIGRAEGRPITAEAGIGEIITAAPGQAMTMGDIAARNALMEAGFTEEEARRITLTSEPELPGPAELARLGKKSPFIQFLFPFRRTPANIFEQGGLRTPGLGFYLQSKREIPDSLRLQIFQQLLGAGTIGGSYLAGSNVDPETGRLLNRYLTNFAGPYSLLAAGGFAAGQAHRRGKPAVPAGLIGAIQRIPLPATTTLTDLANFLGPAVEGQPLGPIPRGLYPAALRKSGGLPVGLAPTGEEAEPETTTPGNLPPIVFRRR